MDITTYTFIFLHIKLPVTLTRAAGVGSTARMSVWQIQLKCERSDSEIGKLKKTPKKTKKTTKPPLPRVDRWRETYRVLWREGGERDAVQTVDGEREMEDG